MIIDDVISRTLQWARLSDGDNLVGFMTDADYAFESTELFDSIRVEQTDDPTRFLLVRLVAREGEATLSSIATALGEAWGSLAYQGFQASTIEQYRDATVMRFVTATGEGGLCVTGEAIATSPVYERLVGEFEREFASAGRVRSR